MNDIEILQEMLICDAQVPLQQEQGRPSVELTERENNTTVKIKGLLHDSIVIRAEDFKDPLTVFKGLKGECKRADFMIVSNEGTKKWIICIETQTGKHKARKEVVEQLKGALCFVSYCKCIGIEFWLEKEFLDSYEYRFVSIAYTDMHKRSTHPNKPRPLHNRPEHFLKLSGQSHHFSKLIKKVS